MNIRLDLAQRRFLFLLGVVAVYAGLVAWQGGLHGVRSQAAWAESLGVYFGIASRQYIIAFLMAIAVYELAKIISPNLVFSEAANLTYSKDSGIAVFWPSLAALAAVLSMAGWVYMFGGLTPETAVVHSIQTSNPGSWAVTQRTVWSVRPGVALIFFAYVGLYIAIPELGWGCCFGYFHR